MKKLLIVFVKNIKLGKVKTRLAKTIGDENALLVYHELVAITEKATSKIGVDILIYFSDEVVDSKWINATKKVQLGVDLGARMHNAFIDGFSLGYESVVLIGSDLPDITEIIIENGFEALQKNDVVFGPAQDGGYYLIGMNKIYTTIFKDKPWSQSGLLATTLQELTHDKINFSLLEILNDIDTFEDLIASKFYKNNTTLQHNLKQFHA